MRRGYFSLGIKDLLTPKGRIDRLTCFMYSAALGIVGKVISYGFVAAGPMVNPHQSDQITTYLFYANWAVSLPLMYSQFCIYAKRLHDTNLPAALALVPFLAMAGLIGVVFGGAILNDDKITLDSLTGGHPVTVMLGLAAVLILFSLFVYFFPGTRGPNRYGVRDLGEALPKPRVLEG